MSNIPQYTKRDWERASDAAIYNKETILKSINAACYYCVSQFPASQVCEFVDEDDVTAICPNCGVDAVLGDATGLPIDNVEYLRAIHAFGFGKVLIDTQ